MRKLVILLTVAGALVTVGAAPATAATHHRRAHTARRRCDAVSRYSVRYRGSCNLGIGSPNGTGALYYLGGWVGYGYLFNRLSRMPRQPRLTLEGMITRAGNGDRQPQAPYDWAKNSPRSKVSSAAIKCVFWGLLAGGIEAFATFLLDHNTRIKNAAKAFAAACATKVVGDWAAGRLGERYNLEL